MGIPKDPNDAIGILRSALERGITFLDNCWDYNEGESERRWAWRCAMDTGASIPDD